jgi:CheY-like chemotaxis protein
MKTTVFYIEDNETDFNVIKDNLSDYSVLPSQFKEIDNTGIERYLNDQTRENKEAVTKYIKKNKIDVILLDIDIFGKTDGGNIIYNDIIAENEELSKIPVIYLTRTTLQSEVKLNKNTDYIQKIHDEAGYNVIKTAKIIKNKIELLLDKKKRNLLEWTMNNM